MIRGETVLVEPLRGVGTDAFGAVIVERGEPYEVSDVVVAPGHTADLQDSVRPDGDTVVYTLHFPKGFSGDLRGLRINVRGRWHRVSGEPTRYTEANVPGRWCMPVEVVREDG